MRIYIMRHGQARMDGARALSSYGKQEVRDVAEVFRNKLPAALTRIWHSTKQRARDTAEIMEQVTGFSGETEEREGLSPNDPVQPVIDRLITLALESPQTELLLVGHLPFVGTLTAELLGAAAGQSGFAFETAALYALSVNEVAAWKMEWMLCPNHLDLDV